MTDILILYENKIYEKFEDIKFEVYQKIMDILEKEVIK